MKIAFVSEHASPLAVLGGVDAGGQNVHVAALAQSLARIGADVRVYTRRDDPALPRQVRFSDGVIVDHIDAGPPEIVEKDGLLPYMDAFANELRARWSRWRPDVVHSHFWMSGKASLDAALPRGIPVVHTFHALGAEKRRHQGAKDTSPPERLAEEVRIAREASHIVATATAEAFELIRMGTDRANVTVVPCGVDLGLFNALGRSEKRSAGEARVVCVTRLVERKGIADVIAALRDVPNARLIVAGGPDRCGLAADPEACRLRDVARECGVADRVDFRGRLERAQIPPLLRSADVAVCYPWYEPFGITPLEAMACGVPVVAARVGGLLDTVVDGVTGMHVPAREPAQLASALLALLADAPLRYKLGLAGARRANERYGWHRIACDTLAVYNRIITERHFAKRRAS